MNQNTKDKQATSLEYKCPGCNASISFNPKIGKWRCDYCGNIYTLNEIEKKKDKEVSVDEYDAYTSFKCESCGAEIIGDEETTATFCVYCGNTAILKSRLSGKFMPNKVIPFKTTKEEAITAFKNLKKGRPLVPKDFTNQKNIEKIRGIYIPFWLYDIAVSGEITYNATKVKRWSVGDTYYTNTKNYKLIRAGTVDFDAIPIDGSTRFNNAIMNTIEPFDYKELIDYNHAYLSGFYAEKYDIADSQELFNEVSKRALNSTVNKFRDTIRSFDTATAIKTNLTPQELRKQYALFPVWMVNVKYKNKMYLFAMNGQTGKFIGDIPLDKTKAVLYAIVIFILCSLLIILITALTFK